MKKGTLIIGLIALVIVVYYVYTNFRDKLKFGCTPPSYRDWYIAESAAWYLNNPIQSGLLRKMALPQNAGKSAQDVAYQEGLYQFTIQADAVNMRSKYDNLVKSGLLCS